MRITFVGALIAGFLCAAPASAQSAPPPVEAYGRLPAIGDAAISPDGHRLALIVGFAYSRAESDRDLTAFRVVNIDAGAVEQTLAPPTHNKFRGVGWADDERAYYVISSAMRPGEMAPFPTTIWGSQVEYWRTGIYYVASHDTRILMERSDAWANTGLSLIAPIEGDPGYGRVIAWGGAGAMLNNDPRLTVFRVDLDTGRATPATSGNAETRGFTLNERGEVVARIEINDQNNQWRLFATSNGTERKLDEQVSEMGQPISIYGLLNDGRLAAFDPHADGQRGTLWAIDPATGERTAFYNAEGGDTGVVYDPWTSRVIGANWTAELPAQHFFDDSLQAIYERLKAHFSDGFVTLESWSRDRSRFLVMGEHADDGGAYYLFEPQSDRLRTIGKIYPQLTAPADFGDRQSITFRARDGTQVPAYLTLPVGADPHNLPLVLLVHGGPHARDTFRFDWWASFLASRGYAVLQVNYRGSTGYGYDWYDAGRGGWGDGVMQHDVEDGVDALVHGNMVDPARVCIVGASYGGYSALAGATLTPDRYACAVSVNGLSDPVRFLNDASSGQNGSRGALSEWWRASMGDDMDHLHRVTPIDHADDVRIPVLIMHGQQDSVVPFEQSRIMAERLRRAHKDVRFVELGGDDHWLSDPVTRTLMLAELETFLNAHIGPGRPAAH